MSPVPCDAIVNESILTGESVPVSKSAVSDDVFKSVVSDDVLRGLDLERDDLVDSGRLGKVLLFGGVRARAGVMLQL